MSLPSNDPPFWKSIRWTSEPSAPQQVDRMRIASAAVRPARNVGARSQLMSTVPGFRRQLQDGQGFKLTGSSGPGIEKVAAPPRQE